MTSNVRRRVLYKGLSLILVFSLVMLVGCDQSPGEQDDTEATEETTELQKAMKA
jgi:hypothetical protein